MSLVNDALRKARLEATRQDTNRSGTILPTLGQVRRESERTSSPLAAAGLIGLAVIAILAILVFTLFGRENPTSETGQSADLGASPEVSQKSSPEASATQSRETTSRPTASAAADSAYADGRRERRPTSPDVPSQVRRTPEPSQPDRTLQARAPSEAPPPSETVTNKTPPTTESPRRATRPTAEPTPREVMVMQTEPASAIATGTPTATIETTAGTASRSSLPAAPQPDPGIETEPAGEPEVTSYVRQATVPGIGTFSLEGIAWSSDRPFALINGQVVGPGGFVDGVNLTEVGQDRVVLQKDGRRIELTLR